MATTPTFTARPRLQRYSIARCTHLCAIFYW